MVLNNKRVTVNANLRHWALLKNQIGARKTHVELNAKE